MTVWSPQQAEALAKAGAWLRMRWQPSFYLAGYAGTGKTTLANHIAEHASGKVAFAAFTGKAASVMRSKGCRGARTIHSLIYDVDEDPVTGRIVSVLKPGLDAEYELIVVDEVSMVDEIMGRDLLSFGVPILVLGDPGQLPPVNGKGFFTLQQPDYLLTEVHRQAAESPILRLATDIREGNFARTSWQQDGLVICNKHELKQHPEWVTGADMVLVGRNDTRMKYNARLRQVRGKKTTFPGPGEPVICLENHRQLGIYNGETFQTDAVKRRRSVLHMDLTRQSEDAKMVHVKVREEFFEDDVQAAKLPLKTLADTQRFTFAYAITCHKSQGSQWPNVCVFDESDSFYRSADRWLYTAVTRASEHLTLVI